MPGRIEILEAVLLFIEGHVSIGKRRWKYIHILTWLKYSAYLIAVLAGQYSLYDRRKQGTTASLLKSYDKLRQTSLRPYSSP